MSSPVLRLHLILISATLLVFSFLTFAASGPGEHLLVEIPSCDPALLADLNARGYDISDVNRAEGTVRIVLRDGELAGLAGLGLSLRVVDRSGPMSERAESLGQYMNPSEIEVFLEDTAEAYPDITKLMAISDPLYEGNVIHAIKITRDAHLDEDKPSFILDAQHHAREIMSAEVAVDAIDYLTSRYGSDPDVTRWVDNVNIFVVPCVNPDGAAYVYSTDNMWRKNRRPDCPVDLNRNYDWNWNGCGGSSGVCDSGTYRGPSPASEPETGAMMAFMESTGARFALSYHSSGEYILMPTGCGDPAELAALEEIGQALNAILENDDGVTGRYRTGPTWRTIYTVDGDSVGYQYGKLGMYAYVIELNREFQPSYDALRDITVERQRTAWQFFLNRTLDAPSVSGHITDAFTGEPVRAVHATQGMPLVAGEALRRGDRFGGYFQAVSAHTEATLVFFHPGYCSQSHTVAVGDGPVTLDVQLEPAMAVVPGNPLPADATTNVAFSPLLSWEDTGADVYDVYFGTTPDPPFIASTTVPSHQIHDLPVHGTFYWRVEVHDECGAVPGPTWTFSTYPYRIERIKRKGGPFRLVVRGERFTGWAEVCIDGVPAPKTKVKTTTKLIAKKGKALKALVPKGRTVAITVEDDRGGRSPEFSFSW